MNPLGVVWLCFVAWIAVICGILLLIDRWRRWLDQPQARGRGQ